MCSRNIEQSICKKLVTQIQKINEMDFFYKRYNIQNNLQIEENKQSCIKESKGKTLQINQINVL